MSESASPASVPPPVSPAQPSLLARTFGIDSRSLILFRIGLGTTLLLDTVLRARDLSAHYTDAGVLPRNVWLELYGDTGTWSLHLFSGDIGWVTMLFLVTALAAVGLTIGWHTRVMALLGWVLALSVHFRNPLISNNGDTLLVVLLMWAIFLPIGLFGAFDSLPRQPDQRKTRLVLRGATAAVLIQVIVAYFVTGYTKLTGPWLEGVALEQVLSLGTYRTGLAQMLLDYPTLLRWTSWIVPWVEIILPIVALLPVWRGRLRLAIIALFVAFHLGIAMTLSVGWFSWASILAWTLFLPPIFWDWIERQAWVMRPWRAMTGFMRWLFGHFVVHPYPISPPMVRRAADVFTLALIACVIVMAVHVCRDWVHGRPLLPESVQRLAYALDLGQTWTQFSIPPRTDGWFILPIEFRDGKKIDVLTGQPFTGIETVRRPQSLNALYLNHRWRKYFSNVGGESYKPFRVRLPHAVAHLAKTYETRANPIAYGEAYYVAITRDPEDREQMKVYKLFSGNLPYVDE